MAHTLSGPIHLDQTPIELEKQRTEINKFKLIAFMGTMCLIEFGQKALVGSQLLPLLAAKFDWDTEAKKEVYETILQTFALCGMIIGSALGGKLIQSGRRKAIFMGLTAAICGSLMQQVLSYNVYVSGSAIV